MTGRPESGWVHAHLFISGRVQGVNFRTHTRRTAQQLGLTGWVRNLWDGRVEAVFEGPEDAVAKAVSWCHSGPALADVGSVDVTYEPASGDFTSFRVREFN
jgi:acylphosphatase